MLMTLQELKVDLLADGIIDAEEVSKLKGILYADGIIDKMKQSSYLRLTMQ